MKILKSFTTAAIVAIAVLLPMKAFADLTDVLQDSESIKHTYAVFDIRQADRDVNKIRENVLSAIRVYATDAKISDQLTLDTGDAPQGFPQMQMQKTTYQGMGTYNANCNGELFSIIGNNRSYMKYGEFTTVKVVKAQ